MEIIPIITLIAALIAAIASVVSASRSPVVNEPPLGKVALENHLAEKAEQAGLKHLTREEVRFFTEELKALGYWGE